MWSVFLSSSHSSYFLLLSFHTCVCVVYRCVRVCLCGHTCGKGCSHTVVGLRIEVWSLPQSLPTLFTEAGPLSRTPRSLISSVACSGSPTSAFGALGLQVGCHVHHTFASVPEVSMLVLHLMFTHRGLYPWSNLQTLTSFFQFCVFSF